jgi:ADP-heptose:LPS heptosyltransferase
MSDTLFTMPGKLGDNIFRIPVAYQYAKQFNTKVDICLDHGSAVLSSLLLAQPWVDKVFSVDGIVEYGWGGQPWNFGDHNHMEFRKMYKNVYHLGYKRGIPLDNTTLTTAAYEQSGCPINPEALLSECCLTYSPKKIKNLCIHIDASELPRKAESKGTILPEFKRTIEPYENVYFIGPCKDRSYYDEFMIDPKVKFFDDGGDLNKVVELFETSVLCGTYSSMWALGSLVKMPQVVVMQMTPYNLSKKSYDQEVYVQAGDSGLLSSMVRAFANKENGLSGLSGLSVIDLRSDVVPVGEGESTTHGLGDGLLLTAVIREIAKKYPEKKVAVKTLSPKEVFENNPHVSSFENDYWKGVNFWPKGRWRGMHQIKNLCETYGVYLTDTSDIRTEIFLSESEINTAQLTLAALSPDKPSIMFCPNSTVPERDWDTDKWEQLVEMLNEKYSVFQIDENIRYNWDTGAPRVMRTIRNARQELRGQPVRRIFALMSLSKKYLGVNTGWMAAATAFGFDNYVFMHTAIAGDPHWIFPNNKNFFQYESFDAIKQKIKSDWMNGG